MIETFKIKFIYKDGTEKLVKDASGYSRLDAVHFLLNLPEKQEFKGLQRTTVTEFYELSQVAKIEIEKVVTFKSREEATLFDMKKP